MIKTVLKQVKQYKLASILTPLSMIGEVIMETAIPYLMAMIIDYGINAGNLTNVYKYGAIMIVMAVVGLLFGMAGAIFGARASTGLGANLRESMFANIQTFSFANIDKFSTAGLVTRMTTDVTNIQNAYQMVLRMCFRAPISLICALFMAFMINSHLSLIFVGAICFLGAVLAWIVKNALPLFKEVFKKYDDLNASVQENVSSIRVVKSYVREEYEVSKFSKAADNIYNMFVKAECILAVNSPVMMITVYGCILGISWLGAKMIAVGGLTTGELTSFYSYIMAILMNLMMLTMIFVMITMSMASVRRVSEVLEEKSDLNNPENPDFDIPDGSVDFEDVCFTYGHVDDKGHSKDVLSHVSLHVNSGETIGIIGGTGSSKTSLVNLISRLYDVKSGCVKVGGKDVRKYDLTTLREGVAVVLQKNELFSGSIIDNLRWGDENASVEDCIRVCKLACADDFIEAMPDKYETYIEQGGTNVSGGQKQRLCIARALLKKPKVLILDDSTSAVDTATDARIRKAFREEIPDTTKFIIAQRISSVQDADRIIVLEHGQINGFDTHENLLKTNEIYREVYEGQTQGGGDFDEKGGAN